MDTPFLADSVPQHGHDVHPSSQTTEQRSSAHAVEQSDSTASTSSDKLTALPGISSSPSSHIRAQLTERTILSSSPSAPSLHSYRAFPSISGRETPRATPPEAAGSNNTSQSVPFEGTRNSATTPNSPRSHVHVHPLLREAVSKSSPRAGDSSASRLTRTSDPQRPSSLVRVAATASRKASVDSHNGGSSPPSRAASPMRIFQWGFNRQNTREELFTAVDPFQIRARLRGFSMPSPDLESSLALDRCQEQCLPMISCNSKDRFRTIIHNTRCLLVDIVLRQAYLHFLLRLPSLYFSRIARVFEDAEVSQPDIDRMIKLTMPPRRYRPRSSPIPPSAQFHPGPVLPFPEEWNRSNVSPALVRFKHSWESFIDSLLREWKTFNLVSALLLSAILSMFQNQEMAYDPIVRTAALLSLTCALMSLSYGCVYIVRFATMRSMYKATRWAQEAQRTTTFILWNVWVMLAMPGIWLAWSMIFFIVAILSFVWRSGSTTDPTVPSSLSPASAIGPRVVVSGVVLLGFIYFAAIVKTLQGYGQYHHLCDDDEHEHEPEPGRRRDRERERGRGRRPIQGARERGRGEEDPKKNMGGRAAPDDEERGRGGDQGGLSAVTGLGLTGLESIANPQTTDDISPRKHHPPASM